MHSPFGSPGPPIKIGLNGQNDQIIQHCNTLLLLSRQHRSYDLKVVNFRSINRRQLAGIAITISYDKTALQGLDLIKLISFQSSYACNAPSVPLDVKPN